MLLIPVKLGKCRLGEILSEKGWEQQYLASLLKMHEAQVSHYVRGHRKMSLVTAMNISLILGINIYELYEWHETD
ncbi:helix-turn-helix domain-containing protein [Brevibacillus laterosporus]|uniref:helix-turn-helix domain-containing protein n=1 Tax=Brevibacillus laterosporus TaxID=1465 RepID=UPI0034DD64A5